MTLFDCGLHKSEFTEANLQFFDKVVGIEANPWLFEENKKKWENNSRVEVLHYAVSDRNGQIPFYISNADTISTTSMDWIKNSRFSNTHVWYEPLYVPTITLDELIKRYGMPDFVKIDTEGAELEVVLGLSQKVPELAFEFAEESKEKINKTVAHLQGLGFTEFGWTDCDGYLDRPKEFKSWEELGLNELMDENRKEKWGMIFCR